MQRGRIAALALATALVLSLATAGTGSAKIQPGCPIDENGNCIPAGGGCDYYYGTTPDCFTDVGYFEADVDVYYDYGAGQYCFNANARRKGTWWAAHFTRNHICVSGGRVTTLGSPAVWATSSLWPPPSWVYGPDLGFDGPYDNGVGTGLAGSSINFNFRWCSAVRCGTRVYGWMAIYVGGGGGLSCYSDRGYIANCRGQIG